MPAAYISQKRKTRNEHVLTFDKKMISGMKQMGIPEQKEKACRTDDNQKPFWIQKDQSINEPSTNRQANLSLHYNHLACFTPLSEDSCQANSGRKSHEHSRSGHKRNHDGEYHRALEERDNEGGGNAGKACIPHRAEVRERQREYERTERSDRQEEHALTDESRQARERRRSEIRHDAGQHRGCCTADYHNHLIQFRPPRRYRSELRRSLPQSSI